MFRNLTVFTMLCLSASMSYALSPTVLNVEDYGAVANGYTDNTAAIQKAIAAAHTGQTIFFPCTAGSTYRVNSPINFGSLSYTSIAGSGPGCMLSYQGTQPEPYAFSLVGAEVIDIRNLDFYASSSSAPQAVLVLGRPSPSAQSGHFNLSYVRVEGYATKAIVYSIASEEDAWIAPTIIVNGGGALYAFYTSCNDDLGVMNLPSASNLSIWMQNFHISDFSQSVEPTHALVVDNGWSSGAGNHTYRDGYLESQNGTAFSIGANQGFTNWMGLTIDSNRYENGYQMFNFTGGGSFGDISVTNNKSAGVSHYLINLPTNCYDCTFQGNNIGQGDPTTSVFGTLSNSYLSENYPFTVMNNVNSSVFNRPAGTIQLRASSYSTAPTCGSETEGTLRYVAGSGLSGGQLQLCQSRGGQFLWMNH